MAQMTKGQKAKVNRAIAEAGATGMFHDEYWQGQRMIHNALQALAEREGWEYELLDSWYRQGNGIFSEGKDWYFKMKADDRRESHGIISAAGAGTVEDPHNKPAPVRRGLTQGGKHESYPANDKQNGRDARTYSNRNVGRQTSRIIS